MPDPPRSRNRLRRLLGSLCTAAFAALLLPFPVRADSEADARRILENVAAAYQKLASYEFQLTVEDIRGANVSRRQAVCSGARQKFRLDEAGPGGRLSVSDGRNLWIVNRESGEYEQSALTAATKTPLSDLQEIDQHVSKAVVAREDLYEVNGEPVPVYVVMLARDRWPEGTPGGVYMASYRIDEESFRVYQASYHTADSSHLVFYRIAKWNEPVPEERFAFAPESSMRAAGPVRAQPARGSSQIGTEAPDFTLPDAQGGTVRLQDFRGKVVVVDFWASWCGPCREQMPHLEEIHQQLSQKDVVVLGLDVGEDRQRVSQFARQFSYTFTLLLGSEPRVTELYFVDGFPTTLVIDRQGKIVYRSVGAAPADRLRSAIQKALQGKS